MFNYWLSGNSTIKEGFAIASRAPGSRTTFNTHKLLDEAPEKVTIDGFVDCESIMNSLKLSSLNLSSLNLATVCTELEFFKNFKAKKVFIHDARNGVIEFTSKNYNQSDLVFSIRID